MSAYVLEQDKILTLVKATNTALELNNRYCANYPLDDNTIRILGKYAGDLHNLYRALYITNLKAVNGRYGEDEKTFPKYTPVSAWNIENLNPASIKAACELFSEYMYQISEEPIINTPVFKAFADIFKLCTMYYFKRCIDRRGEPGYGYTE